MGALGRHQMERGVCAQQHTHHLRLHRALGVHVASRVDHEVLEEVNALARTPLRKRDDPKGEPWRGQPHTQVRKGVAPRSSGSGTVASKDARDLRTEWSNGRPLRGPPVRTERSWLGEPNPGAAGPGMCHYPEK